MKLTHSPKIFSFIFISFAFLIIQFGLINHFLISPTQDQFPTPETTQSIPDTYQPAFAGSVVNQASSEAIPFPALDSQGEYKSGSLDQGGTSSPGLLLEEDSSANFYAESLVVDALQEINEPVTAPTASVESNGGAGRVIEDSNDTDFESFLSEVTNGDAGTVTGIYVAGLLKLRVLQQPSQDVAFVSNEDGTATQFQSPALYGVIGLLAHNFLSGKHFLSLAPGHEIRIIFGSGSFQRFQVSAIADFERMTRFDIRSNFRDLMTDQLLSSKDLFARYYREGNYLTLQTCLEGEGYSNWGVRMISAVPVNDEG